MFEKLGDASPGFCGQGGSLVAFMVIARQTLAVVCSDHQIHL